MSLKPRRAKLPPAFRWTRVVYVALTTLLIQGVAGYAGIRMFGRPSHLPEAERFEAVVFLLLFASAAGVVWLWFNLVWGERNGWAGLGLTPITRRQIIWSLLAGLGAVMVNLLITSLTAPLLGRPKSMAMMAGAEAATPMLIAGLFLAAAIIAPFLEEALFRGLIYGRLRRRFSLLAAALIAAVLHGLIHLDQGSLLGLIVVFALFGWLYERQGTLWAPIIAHAAHNAIILLALAGRI